MFPGSAGHLRFPIMGPDMDLSAWATQKEVADFMGVSVRTVERWRAAGLLPWRPGRPVRIQWAAVQEFIRNTEVVTSWEGGVKQLLPVSSLTRGLSETSPDIGKSAGLRSMNRAVLAHAVTHARRRTAK